MNTSAVMTRDVVVVSPTVTVGNAARLMARMRIRHLPVVEAGHLVGILSDRDLSKHAAETSCGEAMTTDPVTCSSTAPVSRIARLMLAHKIDSVPVLNPSGTIAGLVTSTDLLSLLAEETQEHVLPFEFRLQMAASDSDPLFE